MLNIISKLIDPQRYHVQLSGGRAFKTHSRKSALELLGLKKEWGYIAKRKFPWSKYEIFKM